MSPPALGVFPHLPFISLAPRHVVEVLVLCGDPVRAVQLRGGDVALCGAVGAEEEEAG